MGCLLSRPKKHKSKASGQTMRDSEALRRRISLNKETLDRVLQRLGHPTTQQATRKSTHPEQQAQQTRAPSPTATPLPTGTPFPTTTPTWGPTPSSPFHTSTSTHQEAATPTTPQAPAKAIDTNKPLPPIPPTPTTPPTPSTNPTPTRTPTPTTPTPTRLQSQQQQQQQQQQRAHIEQHRQHTLRILESRGAPRPARLHRKRVPSIILRRRIERGARGARALGRVDGMRMGVDGMRMPGGVVRGDGDGDADGGEGWG
ncbi:uncharacterized protein B0H64DRAFT_479057 [Chaetomium fimeti]|uniref:Uncharacterized protein n=1 Tax=Chaetomium fimeti TaxID=1854472 RepID=A0AAE0H6H6_9PEZI|nr:hypothetical protein B0H64DRAFT_479057 [Chaetomium fimeti]